MNNAMQWTFNKSRQIGDTADRVFTGNVPVRMAREMISGARGFNGNYAVNTPEWYIEMTVDGLYPKMRGTDRVYIKVVFGNEAAAAERLREMGVM